MDPKDYCVIQVFNANPGWFAIFKDSDDKGNAVFDEYPVLMFALCERVDGSRFLASVSTPPEGSGQDILECLDCSVGNFVGHTWRDPNGAPGA